MGYGELFVDIGLLGMLDIYSFIYIFDSIFEKNKKAGHEPKWLAPFLLIFTKLNSNLIPVASTEKHCKKQTNDMYYYSYIGIFILHYLIAVHEKP